MIKKFCIEEMNAPSVNFVTISNWEVLLTLLRDKRPFRGI